VSSFNFGLRALSAGIASALADGGKGRIREAVEAARDDLIGDGALHVAAAHGRTRVCAYLVEELHMDVNAAAVSGAACGSTWAVFSCCKLLKILQDFLSHQIFGRMNGTLNIGKKITNYTVWF
jgi:hypothetical protein